MHGYISAVLETTIMDQCLYITHIYNTTSPSGEYMLVHAKDLRHLKYTTLYICVRKRMRVYAFDCVNTERQYKSKFERFSSVYLLHVVANALKYE